MIASISPRSLKATAAAALFCACTPSIPESEIAAKVNGSIVTKTEFNDAVSRNLARYEGAGHQLEPRVKERIRESVLRRLIDDEIMELKAKELKLSVTDAELQKKFEEHKARWRSEEAFNEYLTRSHNTVENMKSDLRRNMVRDRVVEKLTGAVDVTDADIQAYYDKNADRFLEKERVKASHIVFRMTPATPEADKKKFRKEAEAILARAKKPDADFTALTKEVGNGSGDLGWVNRGAMLPQLDQALFSLEKDAVSGLIETRNGIEIVKVWDKREERKRPLEEVKETIKTSLEARERNKKRREVLTKLKQDAKVEQKISFEKNVAVKNPTRAQRPDLQRLSADKRKKLQERVREAAERAQPQGAGTGAGQAKGGTGDGSGGGRGQGGGQ